VDRKIPSQVVYEDDSVLAFKDINPAAPVHMLVIPKKHIASISEIAPDDLAVIGHIFSVIQGIAKKHGLDRDGFRVVANTGERAGQSVKHLHFHVLGGRDFAWPPG